jgi:hypothetical protein
VEEYTSEDGGRLCALSRSHPVTESTSISCVSGNIMAEDKASRLERKFIVRRYVEWFQGEVEQAMRDADDPAVIRIPNDDVRSNWRRQRDELVRRCGGNITVEKL